MFLPFKDGKIHYSDSGSGKIIVLLHGYLESEKIWQDFSSGLSARFRVITVDLPGHGQSDVYSDIHTMEFMASAIKELLDSAGIKKIFLAGHSMGGYVTLAFLELFPEYLSGYCLFHSHPLHDASETIEKRINDVSMVLAGKRDLLIVDSIRKMYAGTNLEKFKAEFQRSVEIASEIPDTGITAALGGMMARPSRIGIVAEAKIPFLWILGALDNYINYTVIQQKVKLTPDSEVVILKNSGHLGFIEERELSIEIMTDFINNITY